MKKEIIFILSIVFLFLGMIAYLNNYISKKQYESCMASNEHTQEQCYFWAFVE